MTHNEINFSPFCHNVLDYIPAVDLCTPSGQPVKITRDGMQFVIRVDGVEVYRGDDNLSASYALNMRQVGYKS